MKSVHNGAVKRDRLDRWIDGDDCDNTLQPREGRGINAFTCMKLDLIVINPYETNLQQKIYIQT